MGPLTKSLSIFLVLSLAVILLNAWNTWTSGLSDEEAIRTAECLSDRLNVKYRHRLSVERKGPIETLFFGTDAIPIVISDRNCGFRSMPTGIPL